MGDGIMALFGAPLAHEDHAVRACYAALRMQEALRRYTGPAANAGDRVQIRVGVNSGEVVVRSIASDLRMDYSASVRRRHLAARMEQLATPAASGSRARSAARGGMDPGEAAGPSVEGLSEPVDVYDLVSAGAVRTRLQAAAVRGFTRFVGRDTEMEQLRATVEQVQRATADGGVRRRARRGQVPALLRVHPFAPHARLARAGERVRILRQGVRLHAARRSPQGLLQDRRSGRHTLRARQGRRHHADARRRAEGLRAACPLAARRARRRPRFLALEPRSAGCARWKPVAASCCARAACSRCSWCSRTCTGWMARRSLSRWPRRKSAHRVHPARRQLSPEYEHTWARKTYYRQLRIDPLPAASAEELLATLLGDDAT